MSTAMSSTERLIFCCILVAVAAVFLSTKCRSLIANQNAHLKRIVNTVDTKVKNIDNKLRNLDMEDNNFKQKMREFQDEIRKYADSNPIWNAILRVVTSIRRLGFRLE